MPDMEFASLVELVREKKPLVHHITNYVTVNDCANITLAIGASPIMADALEEAADIAEISASVVLNMGTLNTRTIESMVAAGKSANAAGIPVVFDPVGAGASSLRNSAVDRIMREVRVAVLRGNASEIRHISGMQANTRGVDAADSDQAGGVEAAGSMARALARKLNCVVAVTGPVDAVSDGKRTVFIKAGHPSMSGITGTGCMCSSLVGSFCGACPEKPLEATVAALLSMGVAGELAFEEAGRQGSGSLRVAILDAISKMDADTLIRKGRYHEA